MDTHAPIISIAAGTASVRLKTSLYDELSIAKAAHALTNECVVQLDRDGADWIVRLSGRHSLTNIESCAGRLVNEALDYRLRFALQQQTEPIRQLIIAQAFSRTNLFAPELDQAGLEDDPLKLGRQDHG